ncbi:TVP38/TMEM64 family protein [Thermoleophilia bacterium SCSIO 60948]|nr:TVP38/TMEM64 family protein [Thermoleophilia bacterium SCSIO 60948]
MSRPWVRLAALAAVLALAFAAAWILLPGSPEELAALLPAPGPLLLIAIVAAWIFLTPLLISATPLAIATGFVLGTGLGAGASILGATLGGVLAFAIARRFGHGAAQSVCGSRLSRWQARLAERGFWAVLIARIAPAPATILHYAAGLSRVRLAQFTGAIAIGGAPRHVAYAALGSTGGDLTSPAAYVGFGLLAAVTTVTLGVAWRRRARRPAPLLA